MLLIDMILSICESFDDEHNANFNLNKGLTRNTNNGFNSSYIDIGSYYVKSDQHDFLLHHAAWLRVRYDTVLPGNTSTTG